LVMQISNNTSLHFKQRNVPRILCRPQLLDIAFFLDPKLAELNTMS
jgi:hypothetical protein